MTVQAVYTDRKLIKDCEISGFKTHMTFTGYELAQSSITLSYGDTTLTNNKDYTIDYADNIAAGKGKMIITGIGGYSGTIAKAFDILPKSAQLTSVYYVDTLSYTGKPIRPDVMVTDGGKFLLPEHDYTVSYSSNTKIGVGKITISFMGNYQGTITKLLPFILQNRRYSLCKQDITAFLSTLLRKAQPQDMNCNTVHALTSQVQKL